MQHLQVTSTRIMIKKIIYDCIFLEFICPRLLLCLNWKKVTTTLILISCPLQKMVLVIYPIQMTVKLTKMVETEKSLSHFRNFKQILLKSCDQLSC